MKPNQLQLVLLFLIIVGFISCQKTDDVSLNQDINPNMGLYDFYLYDVHNNTTTRITTSPDTIESSYSISPDSKKVLYTNENGINEMNIDGSGNRILVAKGSSPCYSPDGRKIAFIKESKLYVANHDGTNQQRICDKNVALWHPVWSGDGENIACSSDSGVCVISLDGSFQLISTGLNADWYDWSNDSKEIYYSMYLSNHFAQIFKYNFTQGKESQVTNSDKFNYNAKCNPVRNMILFTSSLASYGGDLVTCNPDGSNPNVIIHQNQVMSPCWSPDGEKIAFVTEDSDLAVIDRNGGNYKTINKIPGACMEPKWSNDGNYILYYRAVFYN